MEDAKEEALKIRNDSYLKFYEDSGHYILTNKEVFHDAIIISVPSFLKLERELFRVFGTAAAQILQITGEAAGGESGKRLAHVEHLENDVRFVFNTVSKWGFGKYQLIDLDIDVGYVKFELHNNPLAIPLHEESLGSAGHAKIESHYFLIGFYTGYFHVLFNGLTSCKETKCMNRGDAFCEFEVKKIATES